MAEILPTNTMLPTILEGDSFSFSFTYSLAAGETVESILITHHNFPNVINVSGPTFSGTFSGLFSLPTDSLKYRKGLDYGVASRFSDLPAKGTADLYSMTPPSTMIKDYSLTVTLNYIKTDEAGLETRLNITKTYTQRVQGNWSTFKNQFLDYLGRT